MCSINGGEWVITGITDLVFGITSHQVFGNSNRLFYLCEMAKESCSIANSLREISWPSRDLYSGLLKTKIMTTEDLDNFNIDNVEMLYTLVQPPMETEAKKSKEG